MASFFYYGRPSSAQTRPLASSDTAAYYRPSAPVEQTAFPKEIKDLVTMDINPCLQILGWYIKGTCLG